MKLVLYSENARAHIIECCFNINFLAVAVCYLVYCCRWYRGKVREVIDSSHVDVFLVDYGQSEEVDIKDVQPLPVCFETKLLFQAIECCLVDVVSTQDDYEWDQTFDDLVQNPDMKLLHAEVLTCCYT